VPGSSIITHGCRLNAYESGVIERHAAAAGLDDVVIINSCAVTADAVRDAAQSARRARRERPAARIVMTGCAAQIEPERFALIADIDHVIGNIEKLSAATFLGLATGQLPRIAVGDIMTDATGPTPSPHAARRVAGRTRAIVQVQTGCDHRCTFCIIPFARGPSRSRNADDIVSEIQGLVDQGAVEIVLAGVDLTSYGADLGDGASLGHLVRRTLREVGALKRLRLSSLDQIEVERDTALLDALANEPRLMPHLHLSMQSGDDMILKRMRRRHLRRDAIRFCKTVRALRPEVVFGADLIAGFPTETAEMFARTCDIVDDCGLTFLHVFPYSPRSGTPAARMPPVELSVVRQRAGALRAMGQDRLAQFLDTRIGAAETVLVERGGIGRTPHFAPVEVGAEPEPGQLLDVSITGRRGARLIGEARA
jgi:threonylcarbamoyladenosine tRNA methylthiotransferase MtaB